MAKKLLKHKLLIFLFILAPVLISCASQISSGSSISIVNESVSVAAQINPERRIETVNGDILVERNAEVGDLESVNGDIYIEENAKVNGSIKTTNGAITLLGGNLVEGDITTFNGDIKLTGVEVQGDISTNAGDVYVIDSTLNNLTTKASDITLTESQVAGDINVNNSKFYMFLIPIPAPSILNNEIVIGENSEVNGVINIDVWRTNLLVHDTAKIGDVVGAEVVYFADAER